MAREILEGFGDAGRGEWLENRRIAFHLRRRLSAAEELRVGSALDFRNSEEGRRRLEALKTLLSAEALLLANEELWLQ